MCNESQSLLQTAFGPLMGSFFGISLGLLLNNYYQYKTSLKNRVFYLSIIRTELDQAIETLVHHPKNLISENGFKSVIYSNLSSEFKAEEIVNINKIFFGIQAYNYEAKRLRDISENANYDMGKKIAEGITTKNNPYYIFLEIRQRKIAKELLTELQKIKYSDWFRYNKKSNFLIDRYNEIIWWQKNKTNIKGN